MTRIVILDIIPSTYYPLQFPQSSKHHTHVTLAKEEDRSNSHPNPSKFLHVHTKQRTWRNPSWESRLATREMWASIREGDSGRVSLPRHRNRRYKRNAMSAMTFDISRVGSKCSLFPQGKSILDEWKGESDFDNSSYLHSEPIGGFGDTSLESRKLQAKRVDWGYMLRRERRKIVASSRTWSNAKTQARVTKKEPNPANGGEARGLEGR